MTRKEASGATHLFRIYEGQSVSALGMGTVQTAVRTVCTDRDLPGLSSTFIHMSVGYV